MVLKVQLHWAGHVSRMEKHCLPKIKLYGELSSGYRKIGTPRKQYKDSLKKSLTACCIDHSQWATQAADRDSWWHTVQQAISLFEDTRRASIEDIRRRRKKTCPSSTHPGPDLYLQPLWQDLPVPHRPRQPPACL